MMKIISLTILWLCIVNMSNNTDPIVVITSDKYLSILLYRLNRVVLDTDRLIQHIQQNEETKKYSVESNVDSIKLAK